jgi:sec-independent protein translocase protein TatB
MFNVGPFELAVLAIVGLIVLGPERLPGFARQAAQMVRTLRDLATGARQQLRDELGPEFADVDLRNLNPRTAVRRLLLDDDFDLDDLDVRRRLREAVLGDEDPQSVDPRRILADPDETTDRAPVNGHRRSDSAVRMTKPVSQPAPTAGLGVSADDVPPRRRPRPSPRPRTTYDDDAT